MVSSTFYDLSSLRDELRRFIGDDLGYRPLLSEHPSFPINPDATTIENCRERVLHDADVLVLVVGGRYGSVDVDSDKSVTNLEYLTARQKGIPIFSFVDQGIEPLVSVWEANPTVKLKEVDTTKVLGFIDQIRNVDKVWMQPFRTGGDIIEMLRIQFAYQHERGLRLSHQLRSVKGATWLDDLHGNTLRLALERPYAWEFRLFAAAVIDAVNRHYRSRARQRAGITLGLGEDVAAPLAWIGHRFSDTHRFIAAVNTLINTTIQQAFGELGVPADVEQIVLVAESVGDVYKDTLTWRNRVLTANLDDAFAKLQSILAGMVDDLIEQLESIGPRLNDAIEEALKATGEDKVIDLKIKITMPDGAVEAFNAELHRLNDEGVFS